MHDFVACIDMLAALQVLFTTLKESNDDCKEKAAKRGFVYWRW